MSDLKSIKLVEHAGLDNVVAWDVTQAGLPYSMTGKTMTGTLVYGDASVLYAVAAAGAPGFQLDTPSSGKVTWTVLGATIAAMPEDEPSALYLTLWADDVVVGNGKIAVLARKG